MANIDINYVFFIGGLLLTIAILASKLSAVFGTPILLLFLAIGMLSGEDGIFFHIVYNDYSSAYFIANLMLEGVRMSGSILSIQMGLSMSEALDPATGVNATEISRLYVYLATLIFLATGAYQFLFASLLSSFQGIPMGVFPLFNADIVNSMLQIFGICKKIHYLLSYKN